MQNRLAIENYFIEVAKNDSNLVSPVKLQKLVYFAYAWCLAFSYKPLINENVEPWLFALITGRTVNVCVIFAIVVNYLFRR